MFIGRITPLLIGQTTQPQQRHTSMTYAKQDDFSVKIKVGNSFCETDEDNSDVAITKKKQELDFL